MLNDSPEPQETASVIALGSNLGYRHQTLNSAVSEIGTHPDITLQKVSPIIISEPVGYSKDGTTIDVSEQAEYLNMVLEVSTPLSASQLLEVLQEIENAHERQRKRRWDARTLDIDIITYGDFHSDDPQLTLPHARAAERAFVLYPWTLMNEHAVLEQGSTVQKVSDLLAEAADTSRVRVLPESFSDDFIQSAV